MLPDCFSELRRSCEPRPLRRCVVPKKGSASLDVAWVPGWHELDPYLEVGLTDEFAFWRVVPEELRGPEPLVLYSSTWDPKDAVVASGTIVAIRHPE